MLGKISHGASVLEGVVHFISSVSVIVMASEEGVGAFLADIAGEGAR